MRGETVETNLRRWLGFAATVRQRNPLARARMVAAIVELGPCDVVQTSAQTFRCTTHDEPVQQEDVNYVPDTCAKGAR